MSGNAHEWVVIVAPDKLTPTFHAIGGYQAEAGDYSAVMLTGCGELRARHGDRSPVENDSRLRDPRVRRTLHPQRGVAADRRPAEIPEAVACDHLVQRSTSRGQVDSPYDGHHLRELGGRVFER